MIERIIHYTSENHWKEIQDYGMLYPLSDHNWTRQNYSNRVLEIIKADQFLVGIPEDGLKGWIEYGLLEHLIKKTSCEIILDVPVLNPRNSFVREHKFCSPKYFLDNYGKDLFPAMFDTFRKNPADALIIERSLKNYLESTVKLEDYKGEYLVPEVWLFQNTSVKKIKRL